jgi:hypothetical protein
MPCEGRSSYALHHLQDTLTSLPSSSLPALGLHIAGDDDKHERATASLEHCVGQEALPCDTVGRRPGDTLKRGKRHAHPTHRYCGGGLGAGGHERCCAFLDRCRHVVTIPQEHQQQGAGGKDGDPTEPHHNGVPKQVDLIPGVGGGVRHESRREKAGKRGRNKDRLMPKNRWTDG